MIAGPPDRAPPQDDQMAAAARRRSTRRQHWLSEGEPSIARFVGQIGVLGWIIISPMLLGLLLGRWLDQRLGTGMFWSAPLLLVGTVIGGYSAWKWMHRQ